MKRILIASLLAITAASVQAENINVRALDPDGKPVPGLLVKLGQGHRYRFFAGKSYPATDAEGRVQLEVSSPMKTQLERGIAHFVHARVVNEKGVRVEFDASDIEGEELLLRVPHTGRIRVTVHSPDGERLDRGWASYHWAGQAEEGEPEWSGVERLFGFRFEGGSFVSAPVVLGAKFMHRFTLEQPYSITPQLVLGPSSPGEEVRVSLNAVADSRVVMRVLDIDGSPVVNGKFEVTLTTRPMPARGRDERTPIATSSEERQARTDSIGRLELRLSSEWLESHDLESIRMRFERKEYRSHRVGKLGWDHVVDIDEISDPLVGTTDLGDVQVSSPPVIAKGRVTDANGNGLPGVQIKIRYLQNPERDWWRTADGFHVYTKDNGVFELRGLKEDIGGSRAVKPKRFRLEVGAIEGWLGRTVNLEVGDEHVEIQLQAAGQVVVETRWESFTHARSLRFRLIPADSEERSFAPRRLNWETHQWDSLPEGSYDLVVSSTRPRIECLRIKDLKVTAGECLRDPRLCPLDISGLLRTVQITARDNRGKLLPSFRAELKHGEELKSFEFFEGTAPFVFPKTAECQIAVHARGFRPQVLEKLQSHVEVQLEPALPVTVKLIDCPDRLDRERTKLSVGHSPKSTAHELVRRVWPHVELDDNWGEMQVGLPGPGLYDVIIWPIYKPDPNALFPNNPGVIIPLHSSIQVDESSAGKMISVSFADFSYPE